MMHRFIEDYILKQYFSFLVDYEQEHKRLLTNSGALMTVQRFGVPGVLENKVLVIKWIGVILL